MRYELRVLVGFKRAHRGWSKVYPALAGICPPLKKTMNYIGFSASATNSIQKAMVLLPLFGRRSKAPGISMVLAPLLQQVYKTLVFLLRSGCIIRLTWCDAWDQWNRCISNRNIKTTASFCLRGMVRSLKPLFFYKF